jgi:hypothetical protein
MGWLAFLFSREIFSSSIQNEMNENSANLEEEDLQNNPQTSALNKKAKKIAKRHFSLIILGFCHYIRVNSCCVPVLVVFCKADRCRCSPTQQY